MGTATMPEIFHGPPMVQLGWEKLPAGDYAMWNRKTERVHFFTVSYGKAGGRWEGYTFVEEHEGPNRRKVRVKEERIMVIRAIERNPIGCIKLFGAETGTCSFCHLELTDPRSLRNGYGKKCANDRGLPW